LGELEESFGNGAIAAAGEEAAGDLLVARAVEDAEHLRRRAREPERVVAGAEDVADGAPLRALPPVEHLHPLVLGAAPRSRVPPLGDPPRELRHRPPLVRRHHLVGALVQHHPYHRVLPRLHRQHARLQLHIGNGFTHEGGADADGGGGGDVGEDVGGEEEVDAAGVGVEGGVEAGGHGVVHHRGEHGVAEVDRGAGEPAHGLGDRPDVTHLLVPELGGDLGGAEVEGGLARAGGGRPAAGEGAVDEVDAPAERAVEEPLRLHELGVEEELDVRHVARVHRHSAAPRRARVAPRVGAAWQWRGRRRHGRQGRSGELGGREKQQVEDGDGDGDGAARASRHGGEARPRER
ncbi:Os05g0151150, partial [Oryza sativa Japonica Group]